MSDAILHVYCWKFFWVRLKLLLFWRYAAVMLSLFVVISALCCRYSPLWWRYSGAMLPLFGAMLLLCCCHFARISLLFAGICRYSNLVLLFIAILSKLSSWGGNLTFWHLEAARFALIFRWPLGASLCILFAKGLTCQEYTKIWQYK